ncbi:MAG: photosystem II complex extrinsic protein PsbU [Microcoleaceae cyanobacterium]
MKRFVGWFAGLCLFMTSFIGFGVQAVAAEPSVTAQVTLLPTILAAQVRRNRADQKLAEFGDKLDLNNSSIREFRRIRGMFPTLARKIIDNAPFDSVEDVLGMPGLTEAQTELLRQNLDKFTVTPVSSVLQEGNFRLNTGTYD